MLDAVWHIFEQTGNVDTYLLFKELEKNKQDEMELDDKEVETL